MVLETKVIMSRCIMKIIRHSAMQSRQTRSRYVQQHVSRFHASPCWLAAFDKEFAQAKENLNLLKEDPGNMVKLQMYALFKQATSGKCDSKKPGITDFVGRAKWDAWNKLADMSQDDAQTEYISIVKNLMKDQGVSADSPLPSESGTAAATVSPTEGLELSRDGKISIIRINRPKRMNAVTTDMYETIPKLFDQAAQDDSSMTVITGTGTWYSSGNDLANFQIPPDEFEAFSHTGKRILSDFVKGFINFPKPLVAVVNGPALGVMMTTLALCDTVYASDKAYFQTPFASLGQTPEGCSSYTFPRLMGHQRASEVLLFGKQLTAQEACDYGLVTQVFPEASFDREIWSKLHQMSQLPPKTMKLIKNSIRVVDKNTLLQVADEESEQLRKAWLSEECMQAIMDFMSRKSK